MFWCRRGRRLAQSALGRVRAWQCGLAWPRPGLSCRCQWRREHHPPGGTLPMSGLSSMAHDQGSNSNHTQEDTGRLSHPLHAGRLPYAPVGCAGPQLVVPIGRMSRFGIDKWPACLGGFKHSKLISYCVTGVRVRWGFGLRHVPAFICSENLLGLMGTFGTGRPQRLVVLELGAACSEPF